ncbi:MAG: glycosyltransferase [Clostridia bacterium]|nr:glycosyltransferase [Clostridia bacterium]
MLPQKDFKHAARLRILYVTTRTEAEFGQTVRYRIFNLREALRGVADTRFEILQNGIWHDRELLAWADIIVLIRVEWSPVVKQLIDTAAELAVPTVFDIDDIVFLRQYADQFSSIMNYNDEWRTYAKNSFGLYEDAFLHTFCASASTPFIAERMQEAGKSAFVIHNGLNRRQLAIAARAGRASSRGGPAPVRRIGYLSGTPTHDHDFRQALPAITRILREYPDVRLSVVGYLSDGLLPPELCGQVETSHFMKWSRLLRVSARNTINIAPLDIGNPFCHAKSELKYYESAIVGVPTVASRTDTFERCIENGENGMLASNDEEWYAALKLLLDDREAYDRIRGNAYEQVSRHYFPAAISGEAITAYSAILELYGADSYRQQKRAGGR